ncbi:MAG: site-2 protease family protein [Oligoflexia bacterium]|nr:site-2 protease family protein [Oligoflexia bacterium]MBF0364390.1 site-2 protease family protein [Oligoflexia bacterium]
MESIDLMIYNLALGLPGMLIAVVAHEVAHGAMALHFGDPTAKDAGRLSMNPIVHLDLLGSVIMPLIGAVLGGVMFGWAKPVPINPRNFPSDAKGIRRAIFWVSFAGPLTNFILMIISGFLMVVIAKYASPDFYLYEPLVEILKQSVYINTIIGAFNLIPIPPLDGSKMVSAFLSYNAQMKYDELSKYGMIFLLILLFTGVARYIFFPFIFVAQKVLELFYSIL